MNLDPTKSVGKSRLWLAFVLSACAAALVVWFFQWTVRSSGGFNPPGEEDYYNFLVRGWRSGYLHMSKEPAPQMLALSDPYDPAQNGPYRLADASYFNGRNYLYFGAAPAALVMLPYGLLTGKELGTTTTIFAFAVIGFRVAAVHWLSIRQRFFPDSAPWVAPLGVLVLGFGTHVLALQRRPLVWELPIVTAYAFTMLGLLCLFHLTIRPGRLIGLSAGLCFGLAIAARPTYAFATVAMLPVILMVWRIAKRRLAILGFLFGGLFLCIGAILGHNYARFGEPFEFGQNYQLTSIYESKAEHFRARYIPHNLKIYYFQQPGWTEVFPFISGTAKRDGPRGYLGEWNEPVCGIALTLPFLWLALVLPFATKDRERGEASEVRSIIGAVGLCFLGMSSVTLAYFLATPRYMADFTPTLALLAAVGALVVERMASRRRWKRSAMIAIVALSVVTVVMGFLISFDYHNRMLKQLWPDGWKSLELLFSRYEPER